MPYLCHFEVHEPLASIPFSSTIMAGPACPLKPEACLPPQASVLVHPWLVTPHTPQSCCDSIHSFLRFAPDDPRHHTRLGKRQHTHFLNLVSTPLMV